MIAQFCMRNSYPPYIVYKSDIRKLISGHSRRAYPWHGRWGAHQPYCPWSCAILPSLVSQSVGWYMFQSQPLGICSLVSRLYEWSWSTDLIVDELLPRSVFLQHWQKIDDVRVLSKHGLVQWKMALKIERGSQHHRQIDRLKQTCHKESVVISLKVQVPVPSKQRMTVRWLLWGMVASLIVSLERSEVAVRGETVFGNPG